MTLLPHHAKYADLYRQRGDWITGSAPDPLRHHALLSPDHIALVDRKGQLSYAELDDMVTRFALALKSCGIGSGDCVAIQLPNWREFAVAQQAALRIGAAYVPLLPQLRETDVAQAIAACRAKALVVPGIFKGFDHGAMAIAIGVPNVFVVGESFEAALVSDCCRSSVSSLVDIASDADAPRTILFTSGTESKPKGVIHSYNTQYFGLKRHVDFFGLDSDDVVMCVSPVGHGTGAVNGVEFALHLGAKIVLLESWDAGAGLAIMADQRATMMWGATTFYSDLVAAAAKGNHDLSAFAWAFTAGAPVPGALIAEVRDTLGATLIAAYGQSEGHNITINRRDDPPEKIAGSDGRFHDGIAWKLVDADRRPVREGEEGEIAYRGPNVCLGYLDQTHTEAAFDDLGYIYSGDLGRVDADGYLRIVGRRKDIIIRGGENISPAEVEAILLGHPLIERLSVVGYPDARLGQRACAVVVPKSGACLGLGDLTDYMAARKVAKFKYPERIVIVDAMPMTASGKVRKDALREIIAADEM